MPISCAANDLAAGGATYAGLSERENLQVQTYLLAAINGGATDAKTLVAATEAAGWAEPSDRELLQVCAYLLCQIVNK